MESTPAIVVGLPDLMHAARVEARGIMEEFKGDYVAEHRAVLARLSAAEVISEDEAETLLGLYRLGYEAGEPKGNPQRAYFETRDIYAKMLAGNKPSPVALVIASAALGSFEVSVFPEGSTTVTIARVSYGSSLSGIGAGIGTLLGGVPGGVLGGAIGGLIGGIIDDKKGKGKT
ncbi:hypothetical protein [Arthrobacter dokdonensis]|uniref:hypothetical protein n=1 Tax=Arthrobacter dokdonellae TaxID=2211210 RepID=UPI001013C6C6|nr:hypothetical protein [Arthrobacter dokdonellae]